MDRPPLTRAAIARVQDSFRQISRQGALAPLFYARLFEKYPDTRRLFPVDMAQQHAHFNVALAILVWNLDYLGALDDALHELGARHVGYGVRREHYAAFRDTLIDLLAECAGDFWSPRLREDWWDALNQVIAIILDSTPATGAATGPATESGPATQRGEAGALRST